MIISWIDSYRTLFRHPTYTTNSRCLFVIAFLVPTVLSIYAVAELVMIEARITSECSFVSVDHVNAAKQQLAIFNCSVSAEQTLLSDTSFKIASAKSRIALAAWTSLRLFVAAVAATMIIDTLNRGMLSAERSSMVVNELLKSSTSKETEKHVSRVAKQLLALDWRNLAAALLSSIMAPISVAALMHLYMAAGYQFLGYGNMSELTTLIANEAKAFATLFLQDYFSPGQSNGTSLYASFLPSIATQCLHPLPKHYPKPGQTPFNLHPITCANYGFAIFWRTAQIGVILFVIAFAMAIFRLISMIISMMPSSKRRLFQGISVPHGDALLCNIPTATFVVLEDIAAQNCTLAAMLGEEIAKLKGAASEQSSDTDSHSRKLKKSKFAKAKRVLNSLFKPADMYEEETEEDRLARLAFLDATRSRKPKNINMLTFLDSSGVSGINMSNNEPTVVGYTKPQQQYQHQHQQKHHSDPAEYDMTFMPTFNSGKSKPLATKQSAAATPNLIDQFEQRCRDVIGDRIGNTVKPVNALGHGNKSLVAGD